MFSDKNIVLGVTGGIAAYKACEIVSRLKKLGAQVDVIMTAHAVEFVAPLTFERLSGNAVVSDMFAKTGRYDVTHISLAKKASALIVAPATANVIGKFACGIADDMLTTTWLACKAPRIIVPAMNCDMLNDVAVRSNIETLKSRGVFVMEPAYGRLACGDEGKGKLPEPAEIVRFLESVLEDRNDYAGKKVLVASGATEESVDEVRYLTNRSSGKMGNAIAEAAAARGADVTLICGKISVPLPFGIEKTVNVATTCEMYEAVMRESERADVIIMAAAPADYRPKEKFAGKLKNEEITLQFVKNPDIAAAIGKNKGNRKLVVFSAETEELAKNALAKLKKKNADLVVANDVTKEGAGFGTDTNIVSIIGADGKAVDYEIMSKRRLGDVILDRLAELQ